MKRALLALFILFSFLVGGASADKIGILNSEVDGNPADVFSYKVVWPNGTTSITGGVLTLSLAALGGGDFLADGSVPMTGALVPTAANTLALGSATAEWSDVFCGDGCVIYGQNDQSATFTSSASTWTASNFASTGTVTVGTSLLPDAADGAVIGSATAEWSDIFLADGAIIYGQADQSNTLTSAATGWTAALLFTAPTLEATGASSITLGTQSSAAGGIIFHNATNNNHFTVTSGVSGAAIGWTLPTAAPGGANYLLNVDADGTMGYTDPSSLGGGSLSGDLAGDVALATHKITGQTKEISLPISYCIDGTAAPGPLATLSATGGGSIVMKDAYRDFSGAATQDCYMNWEVPYDLGSTTTITFSVQGYVTAANVPNDGNATAFGLSGFSMGDNDTLAGTLGTEVVVTNVFAGTWAQNDRYSTPYSSAVTVTDLAAGETAILRFRRIHDNAADDYAASSIGVSRVKIKYSTDIQ